MGSTVMQMVGCGRCRRCLAGGRVHGPYPTRFESVGGGRQRHLYGEGGGDGTLPAGGGLAPGQKERLRREAVADADAKVNALPPKERDLVNGILADQVDLRKLQRAVKSAVRERVAGRGGSSESEVRRIEDEERGRVAPVVEAIKEEMRGKRAALKHLRNPDEKDDPFAEDYYDDSDDSDEKSEEEMERERYEAQMRREMKKEEHGRIHRAIMEAGGIKTRADLREEYREIPNTYKRRDGLPGDEMAEYLDSYYPEFGIETESDLLNYFRDRL